MDEHDRVVAHMKNYLTSIGENESTPCRFPKSKLSDILRETGEVPRHWSNRLITSWIKRFSDKKESEIFDVRTGKVRVWLYIPRGSTAPRRGKII